MQNSEMPLKCCCFSFWIHKDLGNKDCTQLNDRVSEAIMWRREGNHLGLIGSSSERADANTCDEGPLNCEASDFEKKKKMLCSSIWNLMHDQCQKSRISAFTEIACDVYWHFAWSTACRNIFRKSDVLLTVHLTIILVIDQLNAQNLVL